MRKIVFCLIGAIFLTAGIVSGISSEMDDIKSRVFVETRKIQDQNTQRAINGVMAYIDLCVAELSKHTEGLAETVKDHADIARAHADVSAAQARVAETNAKKSEALVTTTRPAIGQHPTGYMPGEGLSVGGMGASSTAPEHHTSSLGAQRMGGR